MNKGKYIVIEGPEGVGKTTQVQELARRLTVAGLPVRVLREPDSQSDLTARAIRQMTQDPNYPMNTRTEVLLYNAARAQSLENIKQSIESGVYCIVDRNYLTTLAVQYYGRGDVPDYQTINNIIDFAVGDITPDVCIVLDAPVNTLKDRLHSRNSGERFDNLDAQFLERIRAGYLWEAKQRNFPVVFSTDNLEEVANNIWQIVSQVLSQKSVIQKQQPVAVAENMPEQQHIQQSQPTSVAEVLSQKNLPQQEHSIDDNSNETFIEHHNLLIKNGNNIKITEAGYGYLDEIVTESKGDVYAFTEKLSPVTISAAMARLSRRGDDMRITILDEFANKQGQDSGLLERVITAYGDDSVQQLAGQHLVVENASNILTKKLEWGRLASYLEQSTRYIYFDQKDENDKYKYYTPQMKPEITATYNSAMDNIFELYSQVVNKLKEYIRTNSKTPSNEQDGPWRSATKAQACDVARAMLPVATKSTVGIYASGQALESLIMHLLSDELQEARHTGKEILKQARKVMPVFLQRADKPERGGAYIAYQANTRSSVAKLASKQLKATHSEDITKNVTLVDYWPKNEMLLVPDMIYEHSNLSLTELQEKVSSWPYEKRLAIFESYMGERLNRRHKPGRALEKVHYSWDLICDYGIFRDLQRHRMVDDMNWQELTPRYGFEIPAIIEEAGLLESFEEAFNISLKLHSQLQSAGYKLESQYPTLMGHKMRWKLTYNARQAFHFNELRTTPQGHPGYRKLVLKMHEKIAEVHPLIAGAMKFVNQDEDPELTRLAAERYSQYKLKKLKNN